MDALLEKAKASLSKFTKSLGSPPGNATSSSSTSGFSAQPQPPIGSQTQSQHSAHGTHNVGSTSNLPGGALPSGSAGGASTVGVGGGGPSAPAGATSDAKTVRRKKDHVIHVHPLLDKEFDDQITPPRSPERKLSSTRASPSAPGAAGRNVGAMPMSPPSGGPKGDRDLGGGGHGTTASVASSSNIQSVRSEHSLSGSCSDGTPVAAAQTLATSSSISSALSCRITEFRRVLDRDPVDMAQVRRLCWGGCPAEIRHECWALLTGYHPPHRGPQRGELLTRKRKEYTSYVKRFYDPVDWDAAITATGSATVVSQPTAAVGQDEILMMKQIRKDVPRTSGGVPLLQHARVMQTLERVLFLWALRHPACGYVQGINDLVVPFLFVVFAAHFVPVSRSPMELSELSDADVERLLAACDDEMWFSMEADVYWMCSALLGSIQENFTYNQAGVHAMVRKLEGVVEAADPALARHLSELGVSFSQFAIRWMNCLLIREFSLAQVLRLWDTYLSEENIDVGSLHVFVCASLLSRWSATLCQEHDYGNVMIFLQNPPTETYTERDMDEIISEGFLKQQLYANCSVIRKL